MLGYVKPLREMPPLPLHATSNSLKTKIKFGKPPPTFRHGAIPPEARDKAAKGFGQTRTISLHHLSLKLLQLSFYPCQRWLNNFWEF